MNAMNGRRISLLRGEKKMTAKKLKVRLKRHEMKSREHKPNNINDKVSTNRSFCKVETKFFQRFNGATQFHRLSS